MSLSILLTNAPSGLRAVEEGISLHCVEQALVEIHDRKHNATKTGTSVM